MASEKSPSYCFILNSKPACVFSPCNPTDCSTPRCSVHGIFPGKNTGVGCHFLHQGIFLTQGSWQVDSLPLVPPGEPPLYQILPITQPFSIYIKYYPYISFLSIYLFWRLQEIFFFPLYHCYLCCLFICVVAFTIFNKLLCISIVHKNKNFLLPSIIHFVVLLLCVDPNFIPT